jgi:hypothetical protein
MYSTHLWRYWELLELAVPEGTRLVAIMVLADPIHFQHFRYVIRIGQVDVGMRGGTAFLKIVAV